MKTDHLVKELRKRLDLPSDSISDDELLSKTEGTLFRGKVETYLKCVELMREIKKALPKWLRGFL